MLKQKQDLFSVYFFFCLKFFTLTDLLYAKIPQSYSKQFEVGKIQIMTDYKPNIG